MQKCPLHPDTEMRALLFSSYCPECDREKAIVKEVPFEDLSPAEKRVKIALDVIVRIETKKIHPRRGSFVNRIIDNNVEKECVACAVGALLVCCDVRSKERLSEHFWHNIYSSPADRRMIHKILEPYFESSQLDEIEAAFERSSHHAFNKTNRVLSAARSGITMEADNLLKIMRNIVENNGTFNPEG